MGVRKVWCSRLTSKFCEIAPTAWFPQRASDEAFWQSMPMPISGFCDSWLNSSACFSIFPDALIWCSSAILTWCRYWWNYAGHGLWPLCPATLSSTATKDGKHKENWRNMPIKAMMSHLVLRYSNILNGLRDVACLKQCVHGFEARTRRYNTTHDSLRTRHVLVMQAMCRMEPWEVGYGLRVEIALPACGKFQTQQCEAIATCFETSTSKQNVTMCCCYGWMCLDLIFVHFRELRWMLHFHLARASTNIIETSWGKEWLGRTHFWPDRMSIGLGFW